jgi:2-polyprenyl-3-methyl-5-hydroxy-6-metoxy-1,4-benzoquinol methylase
MDPGNQAELMRVFYETFPYPNRSILLSPKSVGHYAAHAGFAALLGSQNDYICEEMRKGFHYKNQRSQNEQSKFFSFLKLYFKPEAKILLVGCGTDEPLLFKKLHPQNPIVCLDLSSKSLKRAKLKIRLHQLLRMLRLKFLPSKLEFVCDEALEFFKKDDKGPYDFIQCFGVLHHQTDPYALLKAMKESLNPQGNIRLMVYSHKGRRLERRIQNRFKPLYLESSPKAPKLKKSLKRQFIKLRFWQFFHILKRSSVTKYRFRYLGLRGSSLADALLHPSDPGLALDDLTQMLSNLNLKIMYCEGLIEDEGFKMGFRDANEVWDQIVKADQAQKLLSNPILILRPTQENKNEDNSKTIITER